jgi:hypothetical protein
MFIAPNIYDNGTPDDEFLNKRALLESTAVKA